MKLRYNLALDLETFPGDHQPPSREKIADTLADSGAAVRIGDYLLVMDAKLTLLDGPPALTDRERRCIVAALRIWHHGLMRDELPSPSYLSELLGPFGTQLTAVEIEALAAKLEGGQ